MTFAQVFDGNNRRVGGSTSDTGWWSVPSSASATSYTANALNQYTAVNAVTPTYDGNGNLTFDGGFTYCYDAESRLTAILTAGTCASPTTIVATYAYDAQGRRKSKTVAGTTTIFATDADDREVLEYDGSGATQNWYAYGPGSNDVLNRMNVAAGTRQTLIPDSQGSIAATLDSGTGTLATIGYRPFGENPSLTSGTFAYTAQRLDAETAGSSAEPSGLYYYRARMYAPTLGRFLQPDPSGAGGSRTNLYAYVGNDPLNRTDPSGKCVEDFCVIEAVLVVGCVEGGCEAAAASIEALIFEGTITTTSVAGEAAATTSTVEALEANTLRVSLQSQNFTSSFVNSFARVGIADPMSWETAEMSAPEISPELAPAAFLPNFGTAPATATVGLLAGSAVIYDEYKENTELPNLPSSSGTGSLTPNFTSWGQDLLGNNGFSVPDLKPPK